MLAATYAKRVGRAVAFSLAAFRQAFAGGRDLGDENTVLIAAAACEMHPTALLKGIGLRSVREALRRPVSGQPAQGCGRCRRFRSATGVFEGLEAVRAAVEALGGDRTRAVSERESQPRLRADRLPRRARAGVSGRPRPAGPRRGASRSTTARWSSSGSFRPSAPPACSRLCAPTSSPSMRVSSSPAGRTSTLALIRSASSRDDRLA